MKKTKGTEIIKAATAAVLAIGLFSAAFIGVNNLAFAAATDKTESIPPSAITASISSAEIVPPEGYQQPELTVYDATDESVEKDPNAISAEEAAELGAQYIWEVFGESIGGKTVRMRYCVWPSHTKTYWMGSVADSKDAAENFDLRFDFYIGAVSGERADIHNLTPVREYDEEWLAKQREIRVLMNEFLKKYRDEGRVDELDEMFAVRPTEEQLEEYGQLAKDYATKHFNGAAVTSAVFLYGGSEADMDEEGNFIMTDRALTFKVTDGAGRYADVTIDIETKALRYISSSQYDIIPGFNADRPGAVG